jgi:hypothetical protein
VTTLTIAYQAVLHNLDLVQDHPAVGLGAHPYRASRSSYRLRGRNYRPPF